MEQFGPFPASLSDDGRYRLLVEAVTDYAIYMLDPEGTVISWNPGAQRFEGYLASEIVGQHFSLFYTAADQKAGVPARALKTAALEGSFESEGWRIRKDGSQFWAHVVIDPIRTPSGSIMGYAKITRDLTERKHAEETLRRSEEQFRVLVQGVTDYSIYMLDLEGKITNWNLGAQRITGYLPEEILGEHFSRFYADEDRELGLPQLTLNTAVREGRFEKEGWRVRKDGSRFWANVMVDPIRDNMGKIIGFSKITKDITEQRDTQRTLEEAREALFQSQKMEAIGQLTGGIAHDFNNLLTGMLGSLELMEARLAQGRFKELNRYVSLAQASAKRAAALTHRLLTFSRRQTLDPIPINFEHLITGLEELIRRTAGPAIDIAISTPRDVWGILVDPNQLENALLNLCINARDAMPDGGKVRITAANRYFGSRAAEEHALTAGDYVALCISDSGCGMPREVAARAFEPFFTTKPSGEGTGLGLSMVYALARQSGGQAWIESEIGQGTKVYLCLPRHDGSQGAGTTETKSNLKSQSAKRNELVLVVDDEPAIRMLITEVLNDLGYRPSNRFTDY
jgi:PAS domain S-box-containing protein